MALDRWQRLVLDVGLAERADGSWAASDVDLIASRQNGKNGGIEVRELYGAVMLAEWIIHTAHLFTTTKESYTRLLALIEAHPDIHERLTYQVASPASGYEMRFRGGGRIKFIARSRTSGRGLTGDTLVFDEAQDLTDPQQGALLPVISARSNPQVWRLGSAPGPEALLWQRRRTQGRAGGSPRLAYFEFSADPDADMDDRDAWAQANPGLGIRITEEVIESERLAMSDEMFARERLSISPEIIDGQDELTPFREGWTAAETEAHAVTGEPSFAVEVAWDRSAASLSVVGACKDGIPQGELFEYRSGTGWVVARLIELRADWKKAPIALDPGGPAGSLLADLTAAGVEVELLSAQKSAQAFALMHDAVVPPVGEPQRFRHRPNPDLQAAVVACQRRAVGDAFAWDRKTVVDVSPLVSMTFALYIHSQQPPKRKVRLISLAPNEG